MASRSFPCTMTRFIKGGEASEFTIRNHDDSIVSGSHGSSVRQLMLHCFMSTTMARIGRSQRADVWKTPIVATRQNVKIMFVTRVLEAFQRAGVPAALF